MFPRANEDVRRRLRLNVFKREYFIVGIDEFRGNFFSADLAEQAIVHEGSSEYRVYSRKFRVESDSSSCSVDDPRICFCSPRLLPRANAKGQTRGFSLRAATKPSPLRGELQKSRHPFFSA